MLTGADLDTKRSLDGVLVQISLSSQTQTSRQIAWVNVIGVTSARGKKQNKKESAHRSKLQGVLAYIFSLLSCERWQKKKSEELKRKVSKAGFAKLE